MAAVLVLRPFFVCPGLRHFRFCGTVPPPGSRALSARYRCFRACCHVLSWRNVMGLFFGLLSSATFGLIPFFTLPLIQGGMAAECALFYRFLIAAMALGAWLLWRGDAILAPLRSLLCLFGASLLYLLAALLFFWSFRYIPSGTAATIQFLYPVQVMCIMVIFFHERFSWLTASAIALAVLGVYLLSGHHSGTESLSLLGLGLALLSSLCNAVYIVSLHTFHHPRLTGLSVTFWVLAFGALIALIYALICGSLRPLASLEEAGNALGLALITGLISNLTLVLAVQRIGSTLTSILGVMEPLTAVSVGIVIFQEPCTPAVLAGVGIICAAVLLVMTGPQLLSRLRHKN